MSDLTFAHAPRMSAEAFARVLVRNGSPAAPNAAGLYQIIVSYGLDPAVALAFFAHESTYGKYGVAARSLNWGNLRRGARAYKVAGGFGYYGSWSESLQDWCELIISRYVRRGLATVELAIPVYAPSSDGNAPVRYIAFVRRLVEGWQAAEQVGGDLGPVSRVVAVITANVRSSPALGNNVVAQLRHGAVVTGLVVAGGAVGAEVRWLKLDDHRFVHLSVLQ
jgi:hypothetical protein